MSAASLKRGISWLLGSTVALGVLFLYAVALWVVLPVCRLRRRSSEVSAAGLRILITGRVNSWNWSRSHLLPLAEAECVDQVLAVMDGPVIAHPKIVAHTATEQLVRGLGRLVARSLVFVRVAVRERPQVIVGYSFFPAALLGLITARFLGTAAVYQMTGGSVELMLGGISCDHLGIRVPASCTALLRPLAHRLCRHFDTIIVRGEQTRDYVGEHLQARRVDIITGSVEASRFAQDRSVEPGYDIAFVGRLAPVKQPEHVLEVIRRVAARRPKVRAAIVGDGPLMKPTKEAAERMGLLNSIVFLGHLERVEDVLNQSKVFLLTSESEGLSIALAEAMMSGAVPVVADVGDLRDLVRDGETGWVIPPGDFEGYASRILQILEQEPLRRVLSDKARATAYHHTAVANVTARWQTCLEAITQPRADDPEWREPVLAPCGASTPPVEPPQLVKPGR